MLRRVAAPWVSISTRTTGRLANSCAIRSFGVPYRFPPISAYSRKLPRLISSWNSCFVRNRYSTPFFSAPRGARVVVVITRGMPASPSCFAIVLFPTPEGPEITSNVPLLNVFDLLFNLLELRLHLHRRGRDFPIVRLRGDRVGLAPHLLGHEVEPAAHLALLGDDLAELADVGLEPLDLLARVAPVGVDGHFLHDVQLRRLEAALGEQLLDPVVQPLLVRVDHLRHPRLHLAEPPLDRLEVAVESVGDLRPFALARLDELVDRLREQLLHLRPELLGGLAQAVVPQRRDRQEVLHLDLALETEGLLDLPKVLRRRLEGLEVGKRRAVLARRLHRDAHVDAAAPQLRPDHLLDLVLAAGERVRQALLDGEEAMVHRAHLDVDVHPAVPLGGAAESGHAVHGSLFRPKPERSHVPQVQAPKAPERYRYLFGGGGIGGSSGAFFDGGRFFIFSSV